MFSNMTSKPPLRSWCITIKMSESELQEFIEDLKILFSYDNYEEIAYPLVKTYFIYKTEGCLSEDSDYERKELEDAYVIIYEGRKRKNEAR